MKNKKGYTLVEILAVIVIIAGLLLIITPKISQLITDSKEKAYDVQVSEIISAAKSWTSSSIYNMPEEDYSLKVSLLQLKLANLLPYDITNPKTGKLFPDDTLVTISKDGDVLSYSLDEESGTTNTNYNSSYPQIILYGSILETFEVNSISTYTDLGAYAKTSTGENIDSALIQKTITYKSNADDLTTEDVDVIDTGVIGIYTINYSVESNGFTSQISKLVSIVDTTPPVIQVKKKNNETEFYTDGEYISLEAQAGYILQGGSQVVVTDNNDELLTYEVLGNFSSIIPGKKRITYKATDSSGNIGTLNLVYEIKDTTAPVFISISNVDLSVNKKMVTISAYDEGVGLGTYAYSFDGGTNWSKINEYIYEDTPPAVFLVKDKVGNIMTKSEYNTLTINLAGGTGISELSHILGYSETLTLNNPTKTGYAFVGWTVSGTGSTMVGTLFTMGTSNATLTANWNDSAETQYRSSTCATYVSCVSSTCGYAACQTSACGCAYYNRCSACGCETISWGSWGNQSCYGTSSACASAKPGNTTYTQYQCVSVTGCFGMLQKRTGSCSLYNSCSSCGCASYNTCVNSACGYATCQTSECGCATWGTWSEWSTTTCTAQTNVTQCETRIVY